MSPTTEDKPYNSSNRTVHFWAVGAIADYYMYAVFAMIPIFFVNTFGMNPFMVSLALVLPRLVDGFADPLIGHWSDNTHTRWGRRRPFLLGSVLIGSCLIVGIWWMSPTWNAWAQFFFVLLGSMLLFLCWGAYSMNHLALGYELTDDYHQRTKVIAVRGFYFSAAALTGSCFYWVAGLQQLPREILGVHFHTVYNWISGPTMFPTGTHIGDFYHWAAGVHLFPNRIVGMRIEGVFIAAAAMMAAIFTITFSRERFAKANRKHVNIIQAIKATMKVKPFLILLGAAMIGTLGGTFYATFAFYIGVYSVCQGDMQLYNSLPIYNAAIGVTVSFLLVFLAAKLSKAIGKRQGLIINYGILFLSASLMPFFARPGWPYLLLAQMIIFGPVLGTLFNVFVGAMMPDICDLDELQSGERREGLFSAVQGFVSKVQNSLCYLMGGYVLMLSGFDAKHAAAIPPIPQTPEVVERMRWMGFTPAIIFSGLAFLFIWLYPVTEKKMAEVRAQLEARRRAGLAQEGAESEVMPK
jgi:GPH family glycoside/pentoside/hexuronide:cation symporter